MMKITNGRCIRRVSLRALWANRARNCVALIAIALTTVLFTSLFTILLSINDGFQSANFRQCGGWNHGGFKYLTRAQFEELRGDSAIREWGLRRFLGMAAGPEFLKEQVELGYSDANNAHWGFCDPIEGRLPEEGSDEAAADARVLELLGVEPKLGARFSMTVDVDGHELRQSFTLCGWWPHDDASPVSQMLLPESRVDEVLEEAGVRPEAGDTTGTWNLNVMLASSLHIERDLVDILARQGYQCEGRSAGENYIAIGVNWGYTGAQYASSLDFGEILAVVALLLLIVLTGYLIIYNVFQISVSGDIRFYGLLKTIGTTPRQLRRIVRYQALLLSLAAIPAGLLLGWLVGAKLAPRVIAQLDGVSNVVSVRPALFVGSALFSLLTVFLSCARPGRMAARVSPIEALRYTEGESGGGRTRRRRRRGASIPAMAWANLGRSRGKTAVTLLSLSLAVVLLTAVVSFVRGFDMDKYLAHSCASDFVLADARLLKNGQFGGNRAVPEAAVEAVSTLDGIEAGGRIYGSSTSTQEFVSEAFYRERYGKWMDAEAVDLMVEDAERTPDGLLADTAALYGMEPFALDRLTLLEGDCAKLYEPGSRCIAAVYHADDYGKPVEGSNWAKLGDRVTLRYAEEYEFFDAETGASYGSEPPEDAHYRARAKTYRDVEYEVVALVSVPHALSYRYSGRDMFVLNDQTFLGDTQSDSIMLYAFDTTGSAEPEAEAFLEAYTTQEAINLDYESRASFRVEFESFRSMFMMLGGALSFIVGLVAALNFFNAILTGVIARRRELAVLQSIGMTGRQLKRMLVCEGLFYAGGSAALALALVLALNPLLSGLLEELFWFYVHRLTLGPSLALAALFAALGCALPLLIYRHVSRSTITERLREADN